MFRRRRRIYARLADALAAALDDDVDRDARAVVSWSLIGALQMHVRRWAVFGAIDVDELRAELRATGHVLIGALASRR